MKNSIEIMKKAFDTRTVVPAFNLMHADTAEPVIQAVKDEDSFALIEVSRIDWRKFYAVSPERIADLYHKYADNAHTRLHLDHIPVIDEEYKEVDWYSLLEKCLKLGYDSVMLDASRLSFADNIKATKAAADLAHGYGAALESELGAVSGHEANAGDVSYEEVFSTKRGFTVPSEAAQFVKESGCDWLSVAIGSVHGAIADGLRDRKKPEAKLDIALLAKIREATENKVPFVLHGGSGVKREYVLDSIKEGITKINVATELRQVYESELKQGATVEMAKHKLYLFVRSYIREFLCISGSAAKFEEK